MRLAFWRAGRDKALIQRLFKAPSKDLSKQAPKQAKAAKADAPTTAWPAPVSGDLDLRLIWQALLRKRRWIIIPTIVAAVLSMTIVNLITPRYKSEARILIDGR